MQPMGSTGTRIGIALGTGVVAATLWLLPGCSSVQDRQVAEGSPAPAAVEQQRGTMPAATPQGEDAPDMRAVSAGNRNDAEGGPVNVLRGSGKVAGDAPAERKKQRDTMVAGETLARHRPESNTNASFRDKESEMVLPLDRRLAANAPDTAAAADETDDDVTIGSHERITENPFLRAWDNPFSTFSIDVDTASYSMVRQQLNHQRLPHPDSVRIEEMINYFDYSYPQPNGEEPFSVGVEVAACPWNMKHRLVKIGLKGREIAVDQRPASNLVFLLDVSGSMGNANKLGYVKKAMTKLVRRLGENDRVAIAVYAGAAGLVLPSTTCDRHQTIVDALDRLRSGGSTAGAAGIRLAYQTARDNFIKNGVNRVILCTDGDFNVGITNRNDLERMIETEAKSGVFLTILGFGMGNYRDNRMEALSNKGNGNYAYIDTMSEADKVFGDQISGTLVTIAKDVKIQVNFNKHQVNAYRLVGYENRMLRKEDFNDDTKDAGEIGAGHTVTALYEVVPAGVDDVDLPRVDDDKYTTTPSTDLPVSDELLTVRLRYKLPDADVSKLLEHPVRDNGRTYTQASADYKFAASVAAFGMLLRKSAHKGSASWDGVMELAQEGANRDPHGYRGEFLELARKARELAHRSASR